MTTLENHIAPPRARRSIKRRREAAAGFLFIAPDVVGLGLFIVAPIIFAFYVSLQKWDMIGPMHFVGMANYERMLRDGAWWASLGRTLSLTLQYVPAIFVISLTLAALLNYLMRRVGSFVTTAILLPFSVTSVVAATLWMFLFSEKNGYINSVNNFFGIPDQPFIGSPDQALTSIVVVLIWINLGYTTVLFASAIKNIPVSLYEAAELDGASRIQQFLRITIPLLTRTTVFVLVTTTVAAFQVMDVILVMTKGGPADSTKVAVLFIYDRSFTMLDMGYGSALSVVLFVLLLAASVLQMRVTGRSNGND